MASQKYSVVVSDASGIDPDEILANNCILRVAMGLAKQEAAKRRESGDDAQVYVKWYRADDGQRGYVNPGGDHAITGRPW
jgi:TATA-binding protein-associated factor Taf7